MTASLNPGGGQLVSTSSNITVNATAFPEGDANTHGVSGGLIGVGGSESLATVNPTVGAALTGSQVHAGGSIQVLANAEPFTSPDAPDYSIQGVDPGNDTLNVNNHGLQTGDTVQYNPNGHALIGGLVTTYVDNTLGDHITLTRPYNVINIDDNHLALGTAFPASGVDAHREIITFKLAHNFQTGDAVSYHPETGSVSGLSDGTVYYVVVLDDTRIKLVTTHDEAVNGATQYHFSPGDISSNTISVAGSGFTVGQAVQYHSPTPTGFATGQVDFIPVYNSDGTINVAASNNPGANNIWFLDADGNNMPSGFSDGDIIVYHVTQNDGITPGTAIGPLVDGGVYRVVTSIFTPYSIQLKNNTAYTGLVDYTRSGAGDQIIRLDGHTWAEDGFGADQDVIVASSAFNNGSYHISSVSGAIMTLVQSNVLTASKVTTSVTFGHTDVLQSGRHTLEPRRLLDRPDRQLDGEHDLLERLDHRHRDELEQRHVHDQQLRQQRQRRELADVRHEPDGRRERRHGDVRAALLGLRRRADPRALPDQGSARRAAARPAERRRDRGHDLRQPRPGRVLLSRDRDQLLRRVDRLLRGHGARAQRRLPARNRSGSPELGSGRGRDLVRDLPRHRGRQGEHPLHDRRPQLHGHRRRRRRRRDRPGADARSAVRQPHDHPPRPGSHRRPAERHHVLRRERKRRRHPALGDARAARRSRSAPPASAAAPTTTSRRSASTSARPAARAISAST